MSLCIYASTTWERRRQQVNEQSRFFIQSYLLSSDRAQTHYLYSHTFVDLRSVRQERKIPIKHSQGLIRGCRCLPGVHIRTRRLKACCRFKNRGGSRLQTSFRSAGTMKKSWDRKRTRVRGAMNISWPRDPVLWLYKGKPYYSLALILASMLAHFYL
jgi:hypothetical protein